MLKNNGFHNRHSPILRAFSPLSLFSGGTPGAWYDPSDYGATGTLFQDSAGTTPVTAVEQPVGRMLDKSGYGNHAFQATSASRPVLSARYNLLTKTEQFDDAAWLKYNATATANTVLAPDGTLTADTYTITAAVSGIYRNVSVSGQNYWSLPAKQGTNRYLALVVGNGAADGGYVVFDLQDGVVGQAVSGTETTSVSGAISPLTNGFFKCTIVYTRNGGCNHKIELAPLLTGNTIDSNGEIAGNTIGRTIYIWGASLVPANQSNLPYQRVNTATDYATTGFLPYLKFDGVDDSLSTNSISFTSTDKMSVFAGVRKLTSADGIVSELSADLGANNGAFYLFSYSDTAYYFGSKGTIQVQVASSALAAPRTNTLTGLGDISGDLVTLRVNGAQVAQSTTDQGTGNYGNYPIFIGRRGGTSLPFNGNLYSLIVCGSQVTQQQLQATESYVNVKTGAY